MNERSIRFKYVCFDLPYLIFVKDSLDDLNLRAWADAFRNGVQPRPYSPYAPHTERPGGLIIGGGLPVYLPPNKLADPYLVSLTQFQVGIRLLRRVNTHRFTTLMGEAPGDRAGRASFSTVRVIFDPQPIDPKHHWDMNFFVDLSIEAVNKFISHYRVIADRPYIQPVTPEVVQEFSIQTEFQDGTLQTQQFGTASGPLRGMGGAIPDNEDQALRTAIASNSPPMIYDVLDADVRDHLDLRKWRLALIEAAVLFEAWLTSFLRERYTKQGLTKKRIDAKFVGRNGLPASVTHIAKSVVKDAIQFDFGATQQYLDWETKVRNPRNDLVHGVRFDVSSQEAIDAYGTTRNAIALLESL